MPILNVLFEKAVILFLGVRSVKLFFNNKQIVGSNLIEHSRELTTEMGKKDKKKKKGFGIEKTTAKTDKKAAAKQKKLLQKLGEVRRELSYVHEHFNLKFTILG